MSSSCVQRQRHHAGWNQKKTTTKPKSSQTGTILSVFSERWGDHSRKGQICWGTSASFKYGWTLALGCVAIFPRWNHHCRLVLRGIATGCSVLWWRILILKLFQMSFCLWSLRLLNSVKIIKYVLLSQQTDQTCLFQLQPANELPFYAWATMIILEERIQWSPNFVPEMYIFIYILN